MSNMQWLDVYVKEIINTDVYKILEDEILSQQLIFMLNLDCASTLCRFKLTFELQSNEADGIEVDTDDNSRPCFSSILKVADSLDKELAASGFSKKDQNELERVLLLFYVLY